MRKAVWLLLSVLAGCDCEHAVPFRGSETPELASAGEGTTEEAAFAPEEGTALAAGTHTVAVEGAAVTLAGGGDIRALYPSDVDADGDRDAFLVVAGADGSLSLSFARRDAAVFAALDPLGSALAARADCRIEETAISRIAPSYGVARLARSCGEPATPERTLLLFEVSAVPGVRERIDVVPPDGRTTAEVAVAARALDYDEDGHGDVVFDVSVTPDGDDEPATVALAWLDRPSGLARDTAEPEAALRALADRARAERDDARAMRLAERALALHGALCREGPGPRLRFGGAEGLPCRASEGAGRAAAVLARALARAGRVVPALDAWARLGAPGYQVTRDDRRDADAALRAMPASSAGAVQGPMLTAVSAPSAHLSRLAFDESGRLHARGPSPSIVDVATGAATPDASGEPSTLVLDPSGRFAVGAVERTCDGHVLSIVASRDVVAGVVAGRPISTPLLERRPPPPGARCPELSADARRDDGGHRVVGWAPQGVVVVRGAETRIVPLTVDGASAGEPSLLDGETPAPAPLAAGAMAPGGRGHALVTPFGIAVCDRASGATSLFRPEGWDAATASDPAVDASLSTVAYLQGGRVVIVPRARRGP